jgi:hypothetical protein
LECTEAEPSPKKTKKEEEETPPENQVVPLPEPENKPIDYRVALSLFEIYLLENFDLFQPPPEEKSEYFDDSFPSLSDLFPRCVPPEPLQKRVSSIEIVKSNEL